MVVGIVGGENMVTPDENGEQPVRPRAGPTRRTILAAMGAGSLSATAVAGAGGGRENDDHEDENDEENEEENGDDHEDENDEENENDEEDEGPTIEEIEIAGSHGENPGDYDSTDTVYGDEFHVPFSARGIEDGGSFHVTIVDPDGNEIMGVESGEFDGGEVVHAWPEFDTCGIIFCWDSGTYRAVVTATNTAEERSVTESTEFRLAD